MTITNSEDRARDRVFNLYVRLKQKDDHLEKVEILKRLLIDNPRNHIDIRYNMKIKLEIYFFHKEVEKIDKIEKYLLRKHNFATTEV